MRAAGASARLKLPNRSVRQVRPPSAGQLAAAPVDRGLGAAVDRNVKFKVEIDTNIEL